MENRRIVFPAKEKVAFLSEDRPDLRPDEVLIKTERSLISPGTETICLRGGFPAGSHWDNWVRYPWYPGYQNIGRIVAVGPDVANWHIGQRVATHTSHSQFVVAPACRCIAVPDGMPPEPASFFALSAVAQIALAKVDLSGISRAAVIGLGPLGQLTVRWLRAVGVAEICCIGRSPWRVRTAEAALITPCGLPGAASVELTFDAAGDAGALTEAFRITADHGMIVLLGDPPDPGKQRLTSDLLTRGLTLIGAHFMHASVDHPPTTPRSPNTTHAALATEFFEHLRNDTIEVDSLITHRLSPAEAEHAYRLASERAPGTMGILFDWTRLVP